MDKRQAGYAPGVWCFVVGCLFAWWEDHAVFVPPLILLQSFKVWYGHWQRSCVPKSESTLLPPLSGAVELADICQHRAGAAFRSTAWHVQSVCVCVAAAPCARGFLTTVRHSYLRARLHLQAKRFHLSTCLVLSLLCISSQLLLVCAFRSKGLGDPAILWKQTLAMLLCMCAADTSTA